MAGGGRYFAWLLLAAGVALTAEQEKRIQDRNARDNEAARRARDAQFAQVQAREAEERRADEERMRPYRERDELMERVRRVENLFRRRPDLEARWQAQLIDTFEPDGRSGSFRLESSSSRSMGRRTQTIVDSRTGDQLQTSGGYSGDNRFSGRVRVGPAGETKGFGFSSGSSSVLLSEPLDDQSMRALVRLFNAEVPGWDFSWLHRPVVVKRPKPAYFGDENRDAMLRAKAEFGERYL